MYDFDKVWDRSQVPNNKWGSCENGEIPMWVADMDFAVPQPIIDALKKRLEHPFFGYDVVSLDALKTVAEHYRRKYSCHVEDEWFVLVPAVMPGVNMGCMTAGGDIMYCTPMYKHIRRVGRETGLSVTEVPLRHENGRYSFDFDAMAKAWRPEIKSFILCNPHNPIGRVYERNELEALAAFCKERGITIVADEIHCEFIFEGVHTPLFTVCPENSVTVCSAAKICNIPRIPLGFAIIPDEQLRKRYQAQTHGLFGRGATLNGIALEKAFDGSCEQWKEELRRYLRENRDYAEMRAASIPGISMNHNEGTYLAWIDCSALGLEDPNAFFKEKARVLLSGGEDFGDKRCVRINFACPRLQLKEALDRMEKAVRELN